VGLLVCWYAIIWSNYRRPWLEGAANIPDLQCSMLLMDRNPPFNLQWIVLHCFFDCLVCDQAQPIDDYSILNSRKCGQDGLFTDVISKLFKEFTFRQRRYFDSAQPADDS